MPAENAGRAFALVLVDELVRHGMQHAVVAPGSRSTPIALALLENPHVTVHVRIDERSAAYLALGIAKASDELTAVVCTSGTATSYFHGAVMEADQSRIPLLVLTADRPPELHGIGANQTVEQAGLYGAAVRWAPDVPVPEARDGVVDDWRTLASVAATRCYGDDQRPAGPVHLNLPLREPLIPTDDGVGFGYELGLGGVPPDRHVEFAERIREETWIGEASTDLLGWLRGASTGVVIAGDRAHYVGVGMFARHAGWPLIAEPHSNSRRGDNALRATDVLLRDPDFIAAHRPDVAVVFGRVSLSRTLLSWLSATPHVVVTSDRGNWDVTASAQAVLQLDPESIAGTAMQMQQADDVWMSAWRRAAAFAAEAVDTILDEAPMLSEPSIARDLVRLLPESANLVVASSMPIRDLDLVMQPYDKDIWITANRGVSGIDGFVSTAMGVAIARHGGGPTVALCGDLSLLHDINGLMPGPDARPDITYVVINNDGGGIFSLLPQASTLDPTAFERLFGTPHGMSLEKVAAAYDMHHTLVETADELAAALASYGGVRMIEVRTDRAENAALHERLRQITVSTA